MFRLLWFRFRWFVEYYWKFYLVGALANFLLYYLLLAPPRLLGSITDELVAGHMDMAGLIRQILFLLLLVIILYVTNYVFGITIFRASDEIARLARSRLFAHFLKQTPAFYVKNSTGSLMGKSTNDVETIEEFAGYGVLTFMDSVFYPLTIIFVMFTVSWKLTLISICPLPLLLIFSKKVGAIIFRSYDEAQEAFDHMNERVLESISAIRLIRSSAYTEVEIERFREQAADLRQKNLKLSRTTALFAPAARLIPNSCNIPALMFGAYQISNGSLTAGALISFMLFLNMLAWPMIASGDFMNHAQQGLSSMERIDELLNDHAELQESAEAIDCDQGGVYRFEDYSFKYPGAEGNAIEGISFELKEGGTLGLVGKLGSGKTTLIRQFLRLYPLTSEGFYLNEHPIEKYTIASLREKVAYVPQQNYLFSRSVRDNILLGAASDQGAISIDEAIAYADFTKDVAQLPQGLNTMVGEKGIALSGGQKQRISIARALMKGAELLILDDSLSAVDARTEEHIIESIRKLGKKQRTIISAHRLSAVMHSDLILVLDEGRITERGTHEELIATNGWYAEQFKRQQMEMGEEATDGSQR